MYTVARKCIAGFQQFASKWKTRMGKLTPRAIIIEMCVLEGTEGTSLFISRSLLLVKYETAAKICEMFNICRRFLEIIYEDKQNFDPPLLD